MHPAAKTTNLKRDVLQTLYKQHHKVRNTFGKLKDSRRIAARCDRGADIFMAPITLAATIIR